MYDTSSSTQSLNQKHIHKPQQLIDINPQTLQECQEEKLRIFTMTTYNY